MTPKFKAIWEAYFIDQENNILLNTLKSYGNISSNETYNDAFYQALADLINMKLSTIMNLRFNANYGNDVDYVDLINNIIKTHVKDMVIDYQLFVDGDVKMRKNLLTLGRFITKTYTEPVNIENDTLENFDAQINGVSSQNSLRNSVLGYARIYEKFESIENLKIDIISVLSTIL